MIAYHFVGATLRDGRPIPADGEWLQYDGPMVMCESGLHASLHPFDALQYAPGATLCVVECDADVQHQTDKLICRRRKIVARFDATELLWEISRWCALQIIHLWDAPPVVREYLETGNESLRDAARAAARDAAWAAAWEAAWDAAWAAARDAARDAARAAARDAARAAARAAAWAAAWDAARDAAWAAQKAHFAELVTDKFKSMGVEP